MTMQYIRETYNVPAKRGACVIANGKKGVIVGSRGPHLRIKLEDGIIRIFHPTWNMQYVGCEQDEKIRF